MLESPIGKDVDKDYCQEWRWIPGIRTIVDENHRSVTNMETVIREINSEGTYCD